MRLPVMVLASALLLSARGTAAPSTRDVRLEGYAEWWQGQTLIVDGQRLRLAEGGRFQGHGAVRDFLSIPLGYEVRARGQRAADGTVRAAEVEASPNGHALFESQVQSATDQAEAEYRRAGSYFVRSRQGRVRVIGRMTDSGPEVERVRGVMERLVPSYLDPGRVRVYVIDNKDWNAFAMGNFSIYAFSGLLREVDDDELAIVLGHELVHATHEHTRRQFKKTMWIQLAALGAGAATGEIDDGRRRALADLAASFAVLAWSNGYGRDLEDQADRVGLRYAYEAGYDVTRGPALWRRFARKYGEHGAAANFFFGNHSLSSERALNLERELALNYPEGARPTGLRNARRPARPEPEREGEDRASSRPPRDRQSPADRDERSLRNEIRTGMTAAEVERLLGLPSGKTAAGRDIRWRFPDCTVVFRDGRVRDVEF